MINRKVNNKPRLLTKDIKEGSQHYFYFQKFNYYKVEKETTVDSRYLDFGYLEQPLISKTKSGPCLNLTSGSKILLIRGEISPQEQFLPFPTIFSIYISN